MDIVFLFYDGMTALDSIGPHEILYHLPNSNTKRVSLQAGNVYTDSELILHADYALCDVNHADLLLIPGAGNATTLSQHPEILEWIRTIHETTTWTASVCTGSLILGAAGILAGVKATSHWATLDRLTTWGALPTQSRVVESGKIITAAGVSAGIDMALMLAEKLSTRAVAETLQLAIEYDPEPPFDCGSPTKVNKQQLNALYNRMCKHFEGVPRGQSDDHN